MAPDQYFGTLALSIWRSDLDHIIRVFGIANMITSLLMISMCYVVNLKTIFKNMVYKHSKYGQLGVPNPIETFRLITKVWIGYQLTFNVCHKALSPAWQKASSIVWVLKFWVNYLNIFYADFNKNISYRGPWSPIRIIFGAICKGNKKLKRWINASLIS